MKNAVELIDRFDIRTPSPNLPASNLSGGNQQKVIVARELSRPIQLLIANQPTRGLDVGSIEYIHRQIVEMRDRGIAVLLVSAELDEITSLSDRIAVIYHGKIVATMDADKATRAELGLLMAGATSG
jgi:simple sugar transport system ATP-binding protein